MISRLKSVKQDRPCKKAWGLWQRALKIFATNRRLKHTLGDWLYHHSELQRCWIYYYDDKNDILYQRQNGVTYRHEQDKDGWRCHKRMEYTEDTLPDHVVPVAVQVNLNTIQVTNWKQVFEPKQSWDLPNDINVLKFDKMPP